MLPFPIPSLTASSGVNGDSKSGELGEIYFGAPFAVGSGASASASMPGTAGPLSALPWTTLALAALAVGVAYKLTR